MTRLHDPPSSLAPTEKARIGRQEAVRSLLDRAGIDALLVSRECDIRYLTGFCGHDSYLILHGDGAACISDNRYEEQLNPLRESGVADVIMGIRHRLPAAVAELCAAQSIRRLGVQASHMTIAGRGALQDALPSTRVIDTSNLVESRRIRKDEHEVKAIEKAIGVNEAALRALLADLRLGMTEREIGARIEYEMKKRGADTIGFNPIIAVGAHGSLPHYEVGDTALGDNTSLLIDWGCGVGGYNADLTRTFGIGAVPAKIREIYQIVLDAQLAAIAAAAPGKTCASIDAVARDHITKHGYGEHFGHGLGHGLGLLVHEAPFFNSLQTDVLLEPGMVMTVEPGIYLPGVGGVRIEDDIVITERGCRVLSSFPKTLDSATLRPAG
jgi:Xaa-Pro aminopeptidase